MSVATDHSDRGEARRQSATPSTDWTAVLKRTAKNAGKDNVVLVSRAIAFAAILALFPALAAFVSVYGLFFEPENAREHLSSLASVVPGEGMALISEEVVGIAGGQGGGLGLAFIGGLLLSLWSAGAGMKALIKGLNIAYDVDEARGFVALNLVTLAFTLGMIAFLVLAIGAIVVAPVVFGLIGISGTDAGALLRWPALFVLTVFALAMLYRLAPNRKVDKGRWLTIGAVSASLLWLAASALFSWYLSNFANYNQTYGSLGAIFGFMIWLWLSSVVVLMGAELDSAISHQARGRRSDRPGSGTP